MRFGSGTCTTWALVHVLAFVLGAALGVQAASLQFLSQWGGPVEAVAVAGTTAYVGVGHRLVILDIANPAVPVVLGESQPLQDPIQSIVLRGQYAFVVGFWATGLVVMDVSVAGAPVAVGSLPWIGPARDVVVQGDYAYVAISDLGLAVVDIANSTAPVLRTTFDTPGDAQALALGGAYVYVADGAAGLQVVDVSDPLNPSSAGGLAIPGDALGVCVADGKAYIAAGFHGGLVIVDITEPGTPALLGSCSTDAVAIDVATAGDYAFVANSWAGLAIVDVSNSAAPAVVGQHDTSGWASALALSDARAYVADNAGGLQIVDVSAPPAAFLAGEYRRASGEVTDVAGAPGLAFVTHGGLGGGVRAFDLSNPADPQPLSDTPSYEFAWGLTRAGTLVCLADGCAGLGVIDAADPANLERLGTAFTGCAARDVVVQGDLAYVADDHQGLLIVDVSNPGAPTLRGAWQDPVSPGYPLGVAVKGQYAFLAGGEAGVQVIEVSDPDNPVGVAHYDTPGYAFDVVLAGDYAYVADDWSGLVILDVSDPENPALAGQCTACVPAQGVAVAGIYALVAAHNAGVLLLDVSNPGDPVVLDSHDTGGFARRVAVSGNLVLVADLTDGLVVLSLGGGGDYVWTNPLGGAFATPENWSPTGPPGPADRAVFDLPQSYAVEFPAADDTTNDRLLVNGGDVTFDLQGRTYTLARDSEVSQVIASDGAATLRVRNGVLANRGLLIVAEQSASSGQLTIDGTGSMDSVLTSDYQMIVGQGGGYGIVEIVGPGAELEVRGRHPSDPWDLVSLELGRGGQGEMTISDGGHVYVPYGSGEEQTGYVSVGGGFGQGTLTVDGGGSALDIDCMLEVGRDGDGVVWVQNGGALRIIGAPPGGGYAFIGMRAAGELNVSGPGSVFSLSGQLSVGQAHSGALNVSDGGVADLTGASFIVGDLNYATTTGSVTVTGTDSTLLAGLTRIGGEHPGQATVSDHALMETSRQIQLGYADSGTFSITAGGHVVSHKGTSPTGTSGLIGMLAGAHGQAWVDGEGSQWTQDGALNVGWGGVGTLEITDGGHVQSVGGIIARLAGASGVATVAGEDATWHVDGTLAVGGLPDAPGGNGVLAVEAGGVVSASDSVIVWPNSVVELDAATLAAGPEGVLLSGALRGSGVVACSVLSVGGNIAPGTPLGRLEILGDFAQDAAGILTIQIGGTSMGSEYDQMSVLGAAALLGALHVELVDGFTPEIGNRFDVVSAASVAETLSEKQLPSVPGLRLALVTSASALSVVATWLVDADGDLDVDLDDFIALSGCLTGPGVAAAVECTLFDTESDGDVDMADFQLLQDVFTGPL